MNLGVYEMANTIGGVNPPTYLSVSDLVAERIRVHNPALAQQWLRLCCKNIIDGFPLEGQLEYINDFWRLRLSYFHTDTMDPRTSLTSNVTLEQWVDNFQHDVLPLIIQHWNGR